MKKITSQVKLLTIMGLSAITLMILQSCSKSSGAAALIPLGGYVSSDSVAHSNLIAYFPFNNNCNDTIGGEAASSTTGVTYTSGIRGAAYQGASGAYATIPANSSFASLASFSVSVWVSLPAAAKPQPSGKTGGIFFLSGPVPANNGNLLILEADVPSATQFANDSIPIHSGFTDVGSPGWAGFTMNSFDTATTKWIHIVMTYDGPSSTYTIYQNGIPNYNSSAFGVSTSSVLYDGGLPVGSGTPPTAPLGNISFTGATPTTVYVGSWPNGLYGQQTTVDNFLGAIDELRVFNRALAASEVAGLYLNGAAGR